MYVTLGKARLKDTYLWVVLTGLKYIYKKSITVSLVKYHCDSCCVNLLLTCLFASSAPRPIEMLLYVLQIDTTHVLNAYTSHTNNSFPHSIF